ncbi:MAG: SDR family oxidoreductase [Phycisphaerae bacterium]|nr:SDR family oxidoreductase [Phycisphaerae bacterium]
MTQPLARRAGAPDFSLVGRRALVTGSTQGIGRAIAIALAAGGATVDLMARNDLGLAKVLAELPTDQGQHHGTVLADFADWKSVERIVKEYVARVGTVHILVNNTGGPAAGAAIDARPEDYIAALTMHVACFQALTQACAPGMRAAGYGRIINITSTSVVMPIKGLGVSNTVRAAIGNWTKTLASELGRFGITVNNILPGFTKTARLEAIFKGKASRAGSSVDEVEAAAIATIPAGRLGEAEEIAAVAAFLASPAASYVNGVNMPVDGGRVAAQ